jgi:hypothetical protein
VDASSKQISALRLVTRSLFHSGKMSKPILMLDFAALFLLLCASPIRAQNTDSGTGGEVSQSTAPYLPLHACLEAPRSAIPSGLRPTAVAYQKPKAPWRPHVLC